MRTVSPARSALLSLACALVLRPAVPLRAEDATPGPPAPAAAALQPPLPVWPSDYETITDRSPVFRLNGRFGADRVRVEVDRDPAFPHPTVLTRARTADPGGIEPVVLVPYEGPPLADGTYAWRAACARGDGPWTPAANYRLFVVASADRDAIAPPATPAHPRLLLTPAEAEAFNARAARSERLRRARQYLINAAGSVLDAKPPDEAYARAAAGQHGNYSTAAVWYHLHLENVATAALLTGDRRFAEKGVEMLMAACAYERWLGPLFDRPESFNPPWHAALETAMMTQAVATAYDLLYAHLTDAQRETVRRAIAEKGVRPLVDEWADPAGSSRLPRHQTPTGNWVMVCSGSAGVGALALLGEHPEAPRWARLVRNRVRAWLHDRGGDWYADNPWPAGRPDPIPVIGPSEPNFDADGGYKESLSYMNYAMTYVCIFADALRRETGENVLEHAPANLLDHLVWNTMARPMDEGVRFSQVDFGDCWARADYGTILSALVRHRRDRRAAWLLHRTVAVPRYPRTMLGWNEDAPEEPPAAAIPLAVFHGLGQAVMRGGWAPDGPLAAIKFHQNRGHHDLGQFYLSCGGGPALIDSGPAPYGLAIYRDYSAQSVAHNVVLVDDKPQERTDGVLLAAVATPRLAAAGGELAAAYPGALRSWTRDLLFVPGGAAVVYDRVEGAGAHRYDLLLHPEIPFALEGGDTLAIGPAPGATRVTVLGDGPLAASLADGYVGIVPRKYVRFDAGAPAVRRAFLTVCRWAAADDEKIESTGPGRWRVVRAGKDGRLTVLAGGAADGRVTTDARLAAVWEPANAAQGPHAIVMGGTRLALDGRELLRAEGPVSAAVTFGEPMLVRAWSPAAATITLAADPKARLITFVNGAPVEAPREGESLVVPAPAGETTWTAPPRPGPIDAAQAADRLPIAGDFPAAPQLDAPAFRPGVAARASTRWSGELDAFDGDPSTAWTSLPDAPLPQWLEIRLPAAEAAARITVDTGVPCAGRLETRDASSGAWTARGTFETTAAETSATVRFDPIRADGFRVTVDRVLPPATSAVIYAVRWGR